VLRSEERVESFALDACVQRVGVVEPPRPRSRAGRRLDFGFAVAGADDDAFVLRVDDCVGRVLPGVRDYPFQPFGDAGEAGGLARAFGVAFPVGIYLSRRP